MSVISMWSSSLLFYLLILGPMFVQQSSAEGAPSFAASKANLFENESDPNVYAEKFLDKLVNALKRNDEQVIDRMIDQYFFFQHCKDSALLASKQSLIKNLKKMTKDGVQLVYKKGSATQPSGYGKSINFNVRSFYAGKFHEKDRIFTVSRRTHKLTKGILEGCNPK
ncbi:hypothetical protein CAEBREN_05973 [Caenorhabditis brenneri]|uniref:NTF2-like domain-containing protein n=1 Tax=Caenorhabditis brenneri TaxID=135651 RepID=G0NJZ9_CAEBE|nr:hypothetical protein CAEBREN_05973 [Caenorhabditis brenneri]